MWNENYTWTVISALVIYITYRYKKDRKEVTKIAKVPAHLGSGTRGICFCLSASISQIFCNEYIFLLFFPSFNPDLRCTQLGNHTPQAMAHHPWHLIWPLFCSIFTCFCLHHPSQLLSPLPHRHPLRCISSVFFLPTCSAVVGLYVYPNRHSKNIHMKR